MIMMSENLTCLFMEDYKNRGIDVDARYIKILEEKKKNINKMAYYPHK